MDKIALSGEKTEIRRVTEPFSAGLKDIKKLFMRHFPTFIPLHLFSEFHSSI